MRCVLYDIVIAVTSKNSASQSVHGRPSGIKNFNNWAEISGLAPDENVMITKLPGPYFLAYWGYIKVTRHHINLEFDANISAPAGFYGARNILIIIIDF